MHKLAQFSDAMRPWLPPPAAATASISQHEVMSDPAGSSSHQAGSSSHQAGSSRCNASSSQDRGEAMALRKRALEATGPTGGASSVASSSAGTPGAAAASISGTGQPQTHVPHSTAVDRPVSALAAKAARRSCEAAVYSDNTATQALTAAPQTGAGAATPAGAAWAVQQQLPSLSAAGAAHMVATSVGPSRRRKSACTPFAHAAIAAAVAVGGASDAASTSAVPMDVCAEEVAPATAPPAAASTTRTAAVAAVTAGSAFQPRPPPAVAPPASSAAVQFISSLQAEAAAATFGPVQQRRRPGRHHSMSFYEQSLQASRLGQQQPGLTAAAQHPFPQHQAAGSLPASGVQSGPSVDLKPRGRRGSTDLWRVKAGADIAEAAAEADTGHGSDAAADGPVGTPLAASAALLATAMSDGGSLSRRLLLTSPMGAGEVAADAAAAAHSPLRASRGSISALGTARSSCAAANAAIAGGTEAAVASGGSSCCAAGAPAAAVAGPAAKVEVLTAMDGQQQRNAPQQPPSRTPAAVPTQQPSAPSAVGATTNAISTASAAAGAGRVGGASANCSRNLQGRANMEASWSLLTTSISEHVGASADALATGPDAAAAASGSQQNVGGNGSAIALMNLGLLASRSPSPTHRRGRRNNADAARRVRAGDPDAVGSGASAGAMIDSSGGSNCHGGLEPADGSSAAAPAYLQLSLDTVVAGQLASGSAEDSAGMLLGGGGGGCAGRGARTAAMMAAAVKSAAAAAAAGRRSQASTINGGGASCFAHLSTHGSLLPSPTAEAPAADERASAVASASRHDRSSGYGRVAMQQQLGRQQQSSGVARRPPLALLLSTAGSTGGGCGGLMTTMDYWEEIMTPVGAPSIHSSLRSGLLPHVRPQQPLNAAQQQQLQKQRSSRSSFLAFRAAFPASGGGGSSSCTSVVPVSCAATGAGGNSEYSRLLTAESGGVPASVMVTATHGGIATAGSTRAAVASLDRASSSYIHRLSNGGGGLDPVLEHVVNALNRAASVTGDSPLTSHSRSHKRIAHATSSASCRSAPGRSSVHTCGGGGLKSSRISTVDEAEEVSCGNTVRAAAAVAALRGSNSSEAADAAHGGDGNDYEGPVDVCTLDAGPASLHGATAAANATGFSSVCRSGLLLDPTAAAGSTPPLMRMIAGPSSSPSSSLLPMPEAMVSPTGTSGAFLRRHHNRLVHCASNNTATSNLERSSTNPAGRMTPGGQKDCIRDAFAAGSPFGALVASATGELVIAAGESSNSSKSLFGLNRRAKVAAEVTPGGAGGSSIARTEAHQQQQALAHPMSALGVWPVSRHHTAISEGQSEGRTSDTGHTGAGSRGVAMAGHRLLAAAVHNHQLQPSAATAGAVLLPAAATAAASRSAALPLVVAAAPDSAAARQPAARAVPDTMANYGSRSSAPSGLRGLWKCASGDVAQTSGGGSKQNAEGWHGQAVTVPHGGGGLKKALARMVKAVKNGLSSGP